MKNVTMTAVLAGCIAFFCASLSARADDRLIWSPSKTAENAYGMRMGLRMPARFDASAGADVAIAASPSGRVSGGVPVSFWGQFSMQGDRRAAVAGRRDFSMRVDAVSGVTSVGINVSRAGMLSSRFDFETRRSVALQCRPYEQYCSDLTASQSGRLKVAGADTVFVAEGAFSNTDMKFKTKIGMERKIFGGIDLSTSVAQPATRPRGSIKLHYALNW